MAAKKKKKKAARAGAGKSKSPARPGKANKVKTNKNKNKTKKASVKKARKPAAKKRTAAKAARKPAPKKTAGKTRKKQVVGEGDYAASRSFLKDQSGFVSRNHSGIAAMGKQAEKALEGPEGDALRDAEARAASRSRDTF